jgi:hypothetical protein
MTPTGETGDESTGEPVDPEVFPGLSDPVEIRIDERGIPHIYAKTTPTCSTRRATRWPRTGCSRWT